MTQSSTGLSVFLYSSLDTFDLTQGPPALAMDLCERAGASLTGVLYNLESNAPASYESRTALQVQEFSEAREAKNAQNADALRGEAARRGVDIQVITSLDHSHGVSGCLTDRARLHDLSIMGVDRHGLLSERVLAEHMLFETGRPLLIAPKHFNKQFSPRRIVAAWDNSRSAARALGDALSVFRGRQEVVLLTLGGEKSISTSIDDAQMVAALERRGIRASSARQEVGARTIGKALQSLALESGGDVLVMGGYGHSRLREFFLGGATVDVLDSPEMPILLSH